MEKAFLKAISWNNLSNICCWQPSIDFCQNVSKLQLFLESEQKKFYSPADFHARLLSSLIPLQNGIKSAPGGEMERCSSLVKSFKSEISQTISEDLQIFEASIFLVKKICSTLYQGIMKAWLLCCCPQLLQIIKLYSWSWSFRPILESQGKD